MKDLLIVNKAQGFSPTATRGAFNPRAVANCKRYYESGIAGKECIQVLQQAFGSGFAQQMGLESEKMGVYSILPKMKFGMSEGNIIFIRNWPELSYQEKITMGKFFDMHGVALPGKSSEFIREQLPKTRQERKMFELFNISHGINIKTTPEGYVFIDGYDSLGNDVKKLLEFYFTEDGYAKNYFQSGFLTRLGLKMREHTPSKIKTRDELIRLFENVAIRQRTSDECKHILNKKNPSLRTDIEKVHPILANALLNRYIVYSKFASFVNEDLIFIGTSTYADDVFRLKENYAESGALSATYYNGVNVGIALSDNIVKDMNNLNRVLNMAEKRGWVPNNCGNIDYISAHEFGHALIHTYDLSRDPIIREVEDGLLNKGQIEKELSIQAKINSKEFVAEAWAEYVISDSPREVSMKIGDRIMNFMQKEVVIL